MPTYFKLQIHTACTCMNTHMLEMYFIFTSLNKIIQLSKKMNP